MKFEVYGIGRYVHVYDLFRQNRLDIYMNLKMKLLEDKK